jgi:hypothetical protein
MWKTSEKNQSQILEILCPFNQIKNTMEDHSSRLEQGEGRILEFEDKIEIKEKTEEILVKQLKICNRNMQELSNFIKRPNLRLMGIKRRRRGTSQRDI